MDSMLKAYAWMYVRKERVKRALLRRIGDESGQSMVEYVVIIGLVVTILIFTMPTLRDAIGDAFDKLKTYLTGLFGFSKDIKTTG